MSTSETDCSYLDSPTASCSSGPTQWSLEPKKERAVSMSDPYIEIVEEPQKYARFRYCTEGEHGYLYGATSTRAQPKYPAVRLVNYDGEARITCELYQFDNEKKHPHLLYYDRQDISLAKFCVPWRESYTLCFKKLSFVHKSRDKVTQEENDKYKTLHPNATVNQMKKDVKKIVNSINFNKVRLRFSAHDIETDDEICHAYSRPISNSKNPDTNELHIVRASHAAGNPNDVIILLVNKINKATKVRFFDPNAEGGEWSAVAYTYFVHHQVGIVCRVPDYKERKLGEEVEVYMELYRETDGAKSDPMPFIYKGERHLALRSAKRNFRVDHTTPCQAMADDSDQNTMEPVPKIKKSSDEQVCEVPISTDFWSPVDNTVQTPHLPQAFPEPIQDYQRENSNGLSSLSNSDSGVDVAQAQEELNDLSIELQKQIQSLLETIPQISEEVQVPENLMDDDTSVLRNDPLLSETVAPAPPRAVHSAPNQLNDEEITNFCHNLNNLSECYGFDDAMEDDPFQVQCDELIADSPKIKPCRYSDNDTPLNNSVVLMVKNINTSKSGKISIGEISEMDKMKEVLKDIFSIIKRKGSKIDLQTKLERLYDLNLPNGDTFLHLTMSRTVIFFFVNVLHAMKMDHLLNEANYLNQTVLHLAILNQWPDVVRMLVSKGCDPMLPDIDGNNALHQAVTSYPTLRALLEAIAAYKVPYDINATNDEKHTPLHVAAINDCESSLRLLLENGADIRARDYSGRTALHLAACHDRAQIVGVLLEYMDPGDVDATDFRWQTALQIACDSDVREHTLTIVLQLLEAKADPRKCDGNTISALKLAKRHPEMCKVIQRHMSGADDSEDEFFTADDESEDEDYIASKLHAIIINEVK